MVVAAFRHSCAWLELAQFTWIFFGLTELTGGPRPNTFDVSPFPLRRVVCGFLTFYEAFGSNLAQSFAPSA